MKRVFVWILALALSLSCVPALAAEGSIEEEPPAAPPEVFLNLPRITESLIAGENMQFPIEVINKGRGSAYNASLTVTGEGILADELVWLGSLSGRSSLTSVQNITATGEAYGPTTGHITLRYEDEQGTEYTVESSFGITIEAPKQRLPEITLNVSSVPDEVRVGEAFQVSFQVINMGSGGASNARVEVSGDGLRAETVGYLGLLGGQTSSSVSVSVAVTEKSGGKYGETAGTATLLYEDESGQEHTVKTSFRTNIVPQSGENDAAPTVMLWSSETSQTPALAGEEFTLKLLLKNSQAGKEIRDLVVTVEPSTLQLSPADGQNMFFIDSIGGGGTAELMLTLKSDRAIPTGKYVVNFSFSYNSGEASGLTSSGSAVIELQQPADLSVSTVAVPESVTAGETIPLTLQILNMGREGVYNVRAELGGAGLIPHTIGYVGTMLANTSANVDINVYIGAKTMTAGHETDSRYGETTGQVTLYYEDVNGIEYSELFEFTTVIQEPVTAPSYTVPDTAEQAGTQWWIAVIAAAVVICALVVVWLIRRRRKSGVYEDPVI